MQLGFRHGARTALITAGFQSARTLRQWQSHAVFAQVIEQMHVIKRGAKQNHRRLRGDCFAENFERFVQIQIPRAIALSQAGEDGMA